MTGLLDRYVLRRFLGYYGIAFLYMVGLFFVVDFVMNLDRFFDARVTLEATGGSVYGAILRFYAAAVPLMALQLAPFITVTAAAMALVDLRRRNELAPMLSAGRSMMRILAPVLAFGLVLTFVLIQLQDRVAPRAVAQKLRVERSLRGEKERASTNVPHVRDAEGNVWSIATWDPAGGVARGVRAAPFRTGTERFGLFAAERMEWRIGAEGQGWYPERGLLLRAARAGETAAPSMVVPADRTVPTSLRPEDINLARDSVDLEGMSRRRIRNLAEANPGLRNLSVLLHRRVTFPLANLILLLVGAPVVLSSRGSSIFLSVLAALGVCAGYFVVDTIGCDLAARGVVPPAAGAWAATILFGAAGLAMLDGVRGEGA